VVLVTGSVAIAFGRLLFSERRNGLNMGQFVSNIHDRQQVEISSNQAGKAAMTDELEFLPMGSDG
jgi:hypothetical protein